MPIRPLRLLFQGDSITDAFRRPEEINPAYQMGNGYAFLIAARLGSEHPGRVEFLNRGISGQTVGDLSGRWESDALALKPDAVSLLVGVNSTIRKMIREADESPSEFRAQYRSLLERLACLNRQTLLVLVEPFLLQAGRVDQAWRAHLAERQAVVRELAREFEAVFVPAQQAFDQAALRAPASWWAYDGIHPTHAGAAILADVWMQTVRPVIEDRIANGGGCP